MNRAEIVEVFREDPARAFERIPQPFWAAALEVLTPSSWLAGRAYWHEPEAEKWLAVDLRWAEICWLNRRDLRLGSLAREALRNLPAPLLEEFLRSRPPQPKPLESSLEALFLARDTMRRVARAAEQLALRLKRRGWKALDGPLLSPPQPEAIAALANVCGPLPASLQAFWEIVGAVNFVWDYQQPKGPPDFGLDLPLAEMDPLCVGGPESLWYCVEEWQSQQCPPEVADPLELELAPDVYHKANISGGAPYVISLPALSHDPILENERHQLAFTDYLRLALRWGGFPGLEDHAHRSDVQRFVAEMTRDLPI